MKKLILLIGLISSLFALDPYDWLGGEATVGTTDTVAREGVNLNTAKIQDINSTVITHSSQITDLNESKEPLISKLTAFNKNFGDTNGTVTEGNDYRLSNARTPTEHDHNTTDIDDFDAMVTNSPTVASHTSKILTLEGDLNSSVDELNSSIELRVVKNSPITGATHAKITYDSKGLVTDGGSLVEGDIPTLSQSKITNLETNLSNKINKITSTANAIPSFSNTAGDLKTNTSYLNNMHLGLGVTPYPWTDSFGTVDLLNGGALFGNTLATFLNYNAYFDGANWKYKADGTVGQLRVGKDGALQMYIAPTGVAGGNINLVENFRVSNSGYIKTSVDTPATKKKKLTGTTANAQGGTITVVHGLTSNKILSILPKVMDIPANGVMPEYTGATGYNYSCYHDSTNIVIILDPTNSANILSKPFTVLIEYEE